MVFGKSSVLVGTCASSCINYMKVVADKSELVREIPSACADERAAVEFMERQRWGDTPACPRCGDCEVSQMRDKGGNRNARFLWHCKGCKKQFTVRVGTIMEDSPIPLRFWCLAFYRACASLRRASALADQTRNRSELQVGALHDAPDSARYGRRGSGTGSSKSTRR